MARRKLSTEDQLKGVRAALKSRRTPPQLKPGLKRRAEELEKKLRAEGKSSERTKSRKGLLDFIWD
jgi:hypothetical protein